MDDLVKRLKEIFGDKIDDFNNSKCMDMCYRYKLIRMRIFLPDQRECLENIGTDMEISQALLTIIKVPFIVSIGRELDKKIWGMTISRVFVPQTA